MYSPSEETYSETEDERKEDVGKSHFYFISINIVTLYIYVDKIQR
jgi:hypothetical protein